MSIVSKVKTSAMGQRIVRCYPYAYWKHHKTAQALVAKFCPDLGTKQRLLIVRRMINVFCRYRFGFDEFLCYGLQDLSKPIDPEWVADVDRMFWVDQFNSREDRWVFADKWATYKKFKKYFHRIVCRPDEEGAEFVARHSSFIVKPRDGSLGHGVKKCDKRDDESVTDCIARVAASPQKVIFEELIEQVDQMAVFHPQSVNTVRMSVIRLNDATVVFRPFMRLGRGGAIVDNAGQGGLIAAISAEDGEVIACGDEYGRHYDKHPDTGVRIVGFKVPAWEEACCLGRELAEQMPSMRYLSWDLALTDGGWVVVEGNEMGQIVSPLVTNIGVRSELNSYLRRI